MTAGTGKTYSKNRVKIWKSEFAVEREKSMEKYDFAKQPSILIQGAMDTETEYLIAHLEDGACITLGNWKFHTGFLGENREPIVISRTYQGMVNAAAATSLALVHFAPKAVINQGIGGGHDTRFHRGDIVLGERVVPMGAVMRHFSEAGAGIDETDFEPLEIEIYNRKKGLLEKVLDFPCDGTLLAIAERVNAPCRTSRGVLGSADEWNNQLDWIALLRERYQTASEDMESAAAAELCLSYGIPFIGVRILSNSIVNGEEFDESVGIDGQKYIISYVEALHGFGGRA